MGRSVRLSDATRDHIVSKGMKAFDTAYEVPQIEGELAVRASQAVQRLKGQDDYHRLRKLAEKIKLNVRNVSGSCRQQAVQQFLDRSDNEIVNRVRIEIAPEHKGLQQWQAHVIKLPEPVSIPYAEKDRYSRTGESCYKVYTNELQDEDLVFLTQAVTEVRKLKDVWDQKRKGYEDQLRQLVKLSNSTRQLINRLPVAENWLPQEVIQKMHTDADNNDTKATEEALAALDIDESLFKQTHVISKVVGD
jgi:hypothetical protein